MPNGEFLELDMHEFLLILQLCFKSYKDLIFAYFDDTKPNNSATFPSYK